MVLVKKFFVEKAIAQARIDEYLAKRFYRAGYAGVQIIQFPLGTKVFIDAERPAMIIGRRGETIRQLAAIFEHQFGLQNPQITVRRVENPDLNARVAASRIAVFLERGAYYRRVANVMARRILNAGAIGVQIIISGKLRTERARYEKVRVGKVYSTGYQVEYMVDRAVMHITLKPGTFGIEVTIVKPAKPSDYVRIKEPEEAKDFIEEVREELEKIRAAEAEKLKEAAAEAPSEEAEAVEEEEPEEAKV
ncbi:30S ribosomal protein S3 [Pyrodictium occultum]|uniref:Small ribosomal subunit protein uS3 n=1 Tax=Pyrodictium occultum TaxID=2309 RepID=A0A0V8RWK9_PYROC|nr:30S ribosomal protein S3 [Pyrodictium occultum]KSW12362.1 30S ribosomal protein S3 [Pyrodictium occultum]